MSAPQRTDTDKSWTVADYMALDDEQQYELIEGELLVAPAPASPHQHIVIALAAMLWTHVREHGLGHCFAAPFDVVLADDTVVQPDLLFVSAARWPQLDDGHGITGAPDLVVEVLSPSTGRRDRTQKLELYRRAGVPWVLLIDPALRTAEALELDDNSGKYTIDQSVGGDDTVVIGLFPELEIALASLWLDPSSAV